MTRFENSRMVLINSQACDVTVMNHNNKFRTFVNIVYRDLFMAHVACRGINNSLLCMQQLISIAEALVFIFVSSREVAFYLYRSLYVTTSQRRAEQPDCAVNPSLLQQLGQRRLTVWMVHKWQLSLTLSLSLSRSVWIYSEERAYCKLVQI